MKRKIAFILALVLVAMALVACGSKKVVSDVEPNPFVGEWEVDEAFFSEVWTFGADGKGENENDILSYEFEYTYLEGKLNVYQIWFGSTSDEPIVYDVEFDGDDTVTISDGDYEYVLLKK